MARPARRPGNLPPEATSFVGRRAELAEVRARLTAARLVSLTGPGGVGKTRLALRAAAGLTRGFRDGAWLVELAEVRDPAMVAGTVLAALDLRDQVAADPAARLLAYLRDRTLLLVLDNCEHLLGAAAALVAGVLRAAPQVRVLVTSREPLSVAGEHVLPVPPLHMPTGDPTGDPRRNDAVALFADRAAAATGAFELTEANRGAVAELCLRLDGLPLAIELAAVRTRVLAVEQLLERLTDRFGLLTGGGRATLARQQTLRATIDWSHDLLDAGEQALLRRLCVFAGRFTLEDAIAVSDAADVLGPLSSLIDKSLVGRDDAGGVAGYRLHETMREYAALRLRDAGEQADVEGRCERYYRERCRRAAPDARYRLADWLSWMDLEIDNVRAVLQRCRARGDREAELELTGTIGWYWITRATGEGIRRLDDLLPDDARPPALALFLRGFLAVLQSDPAAARPALERAAAAADHPGLRAESLAMASVAANTAGDRAAGARLLAAAQALAADLDDYPATAAVLQARSLGGLFAGDLAAARQASAEGVAASRAAGDLYVLDMMLMNLGYAALAAGDLAAAEPPLAEAMRIARRLDDRVAQFCLLDALGCHAAGTGRPALAARLLGAAATVQRGVGAEILPHLAPLLARATASTRAALGAAAFAAEFGAGGLLGRSAAIGLALGEPEMQASPAPSPLRPREAEVARLVAEGLSNRQIGGRLHISEHTVDSHIRSILTRLGFGSRSQIAAWITAAVDK